MTSIEVVPLRPGETREFIRFPFAVYKRDQLWTPPLIWEQRALLDPRRNPFFEHGQAQLFLARRKGATVARLGAIVNEAHDRHHHEHAGFFGFLEVLPGEEAAWRHLLEAASTWLRQRGATFIRGPVNFSMNELDAGLLVEGFGTRPIFRSAHNPPYYAQLIEDAGFTKCKDLLAFYRYYYPSPEPIFGKVVARLKRRHAVQIRPIDYRDFDAEVTRITAVYNDAWSDNWGFVPVTPAEARHLARALKFALVPEMAFIAEVDGKPVGCFLAIPDLNQVLRPMRGRVTPWGVFRALCRRRRIDSARVVLTGVVKPYRGLGIELILMIEMSKLTPRRGIHWEGSWVLEDNLPVLGLMQRLGAVPYKRYRLYEKSLVDREPMRS